MSNGGLSIKHRVMDESKVDDGKGCTKPAHEFFQIDHPATGLARTWGSTHGDGLVAT
jgi:hypothetical protein